MALLQENIILYRRIWVLEDELWQNDIAVLH